MYQDLNEQLMWVTNFFMVGIALVAFMLLLLWLINWKRW